MPEAPALSSADMLAIEVSAGIGAFIVNAAAAAGVPAAELEKRTGFAPSWADDPDARANNAAFLHLLPPHVAVAKPFSAPIKALV